MLTNYGKEEAMINPIEISNEQGVHRKPTIDRTKTHIDDWKSFCDEMCIQQKPLTIENYLSWECERNRKLTDELIRKFRFIRNEERARSVKKLIN